MGVYKRGEIWYARYWTNGKEKSEAVGPKKRDAEDVLAKRRAQIREGKFFETAPGWMKPYSDILDRYLDYSVAFKRPRTYLLDRGVITRLRQELGEYQVRQLSPSR